MSGRRARKLRKTPGTPEHSAWRRKLVRRAERAGEEVEHDGHNRRQRRRVDHFARAVEAAPIRLACEGRETVYLDHVDEDEVDYRDAIFALTGGNL